MDMTWTLLIICVLTGLIPLAFTAGVAAGKDIGRDEARRELSRRG